MTIGVVVTDQHDHQLRAIEPFTDLGVAPVVNPFGLSLPGGPAVRRGGEVVVADSGHDRVALWDVASNVWQLFGAPGAGPNQFSKPAAAAADADGRIFIADSGNHRIVRIDDLTGAGWAAFGAPGGPTPNDPGEGLFRTPLGVAVDSRGRIIVTDPGAGRAVRLAALDGSGWTVLALPAGAAPIRPLGVAAAEDWFAVSDVGNRAVHLFDLDDRHLTSLDGTTAGLPVPAYLAGDGDILAVADIVANELRRYRVENDTLTLVDIVRGSSPERTSILFQRIGGIALGAR